MTALHDLSVSFTKTDNLEPLRGLTALQSLFVLGTAVKNLEPIEGLTTLQILGLGGWVPQDEKTRFFRSRREKGLPPLKTE